MTTVATLYPTFLDLDGDPLDNGYIYIGTENQNPQTSPKQAYWDEALTIPAVQPLRTIGGYIVRNGTPANVYTSGAYSATVRNRSGALVCTASSVTDLANLLSAPGGAARVGVSGGGTVQDNISCQVVDYTAFRASTSTAKQVEVTGYLVTAVPQVIAGTFVLDDSGAGADNGGTIIVRTDGKRFRRIYDGGIYADWFGATGDGTTNDTAAIRSALAYAYSLTYGGEVLLGQGSYAVTEINATLFSDFAKAVTLRGCGREATRIIPFAAGNVLFNLMGTNNFTLSNLTFDSTALASQCSIFMARTTVSTNCNNNQFRDVYVKGSYSKAGVIVNGAESSKWFGGRIENTNAAAKYKCLSTGGDVGCQTYQGVTTVNGGTILDSSNPNTNNFMFGTEFYAAFGNGAEPVEFIYNSHYVMSGVTIVAGSVNDAILAKYVPRVAGSNTFIGPVVWDSEHFEVFGTGNIAHYLECNNSTAYFNGISSVGKPLYQFGSSNPTVLIDYGRQDVLAQPILRGTNWVSPTVSAGATDVRAYCYGLYGGSMVLRCNEGANAGTLFAPGFSWNAAIDVSRLLGGSTRFLSGTFTTVATAVPTADSFTVGTTILRETPVVGQPIGWKCTVSGTLGTLNGGVTTGDITINTCILALSSATGAEEGQRITVAGAGGPFYIRKLVGTTAYLDSNATATVAGAAVGFSAATLVAMANL